MLLQRRNICAHVMLLGMHSLACGRNSTALPAEDSAANHL